MGQVAHERSWKMGCLDGIGKGTGDTTERNLAFWWQAFGFTLRQIDHEHQFSLWHRGSVEQADKSRLNEARQLVRSAGKKPVVVGPN